MYWKEEKDIEVLLYVQLYVKGNKKGLWIKNKINFEKYWTGRIIIKACAKLFASIKSKMQQ